MISTRLSLLSQGTITNYGNIMVNNQEDIDIQCLHFENYGKIQSNDHENKIKIHCTSFENDGIILPEPEPTILTALECLDFLEYDGLKQQILIDEDKMNNVRVKEWMLMVLKSIKYEIKYLDANENALKSQEYECKENKDFAIPIDHNNLWYSSVCIKLTQNDERSKSFKLSKVNEFVFGEQKEPFCIAQAINVSEYGDGLSLSIKCAADIVIEKIGSIFSNEAVKRFEYESDFDENGIFYALGTGFGTKKFSNPVKIGL